MRYPQSQMKMLVLLVLLPSVVWGQCFSANDQTTPDNEDKTILYKGQLQFTTDFLNVLNKATPTENVFFSPLSIYNALILAYFTAANKTEEGLKKILHIPETKEKINIVRAYKIEKYFKNMEALKTSADYELLNANRLFVSDKLQVRQCMKELLMEEIKPTDFQSDPQAAIKMINEWVANQTKNNIKDLLSSDALTPATNLVLANCAYFKGLWKNKFPQEATRKDVFYISASENTLVPMMKQKSTFNYAVSDKLGAHILEMPYKGDHVSIIFLLPPFTSPSGVANILERMKTYDIPKIIDDLSERQVEVTIPKFDIEVETKLIEHLKNLGVGDLFDSTSDLSVLTGKNEVKLDDAIHKAKISLDEEGTTAAAATAIFNFRSSRPLDPVSFNANHPFVYVIFNKINKTVLFAGVFNRPPPA